MLRVNQEKNYWNEAAEQPDVDESFICDIPDEKFRFIPPVVSMSNKYLDLGCGVGRLMKNFDNFYGVDISENMLKIAKERKPNCHFKLCDGRTIPYEDDTFDYVYSILLFQHLPFAAVCSYITEAMRVLKKGGVFIFQYIEGNEQEPFSIHHKARLIEYHIQKSGYKVAKKTTGLVHESWTWVEVIK